MAWKNTEDTYGSVSKILHWLIGLVIICLLASGLYMSGMEPNALKGQVYGLHKMFGLITISLVILRIIWKIINKGTPAPLESHSRVEVIMAKSAHGTLYILMLIMPLSGLLMSSFGGYPVMALGIDWALPLDKNEGLSSLFHEVHEIAGYILIALISLHVLGAIKHHVINKDDTLKRMLPQCPKKCCGVCDSDDKDKL